MRILIKVKPNNARVIGTAYSLSGAYYFRKCCIGYNVRYKPNIKNELFVWENKSPRICGERYEILQIH